MSFLGVKRASTDTTESGAKDGKVESDEFRIPEQDLEKDSIKKEVIAEEYEDETDSTLSTSEAIEITLKDIDEVVDLHERDVDAPAGTIRMWVLAIGLSTVISGVDVFFAFRFPSISIGAIVAQLLAYPLGLLWHMIVPEWTIRIGKWSLPLNPGRFNTKEHALIYLFTNTVASTGLLSNTQIEQVKFFKNDYGIGRFILFDIAGFLISWGLAGFSLPILVDREEVIWPGVLNSCALFKALHNYKEPSIRGWKITRFNFFICAFTASFIWYWFSDLIIPFIASLGAFPSWSRPKNAVLGQVFGTTNGLGLLPLTFDWPTISNLGNPLLVPLWAAATIFASFVFWVWIVVPAMYYQNKWHTAHLPLLSNNLFDKKGTSYKINSVVTKKWQIDLEKYKAYSPVFIPVGFLMSLALSLGGFSAVMISFFWKFKTDAWEPLFKKETHSTSHYIVASGKKFKTFYVCSILVGLALGFVFSEAWHEAAQLGAGGYLVSALIGILIFVPVALVEYRSTFELNMNGFFNVVGAFWFKGKPIATLYFLNTGFSIFEHAMHYTQGAKLGFYMKTPPKLTMFVLLAAGIWASLVTSSVAGFVLYHIDNVCTAAAKNHMICKKQQTAFNTQILWGLFGHKIFGDGGRYNFIMYFFLVGAVVSCIVIVMQIWRPKSVFWAKANPALFMAGAENIPTSTGINYSAWFIVAMIFNYYIHKKHTAWWRKYNLILAAGLDCGVAIAAILVYFCVVYTGGSANYSWWGTEVASSSCDSKGCPYLPAKKIDASGITW